METGQLPNELCNLRTRASSRVKPKSSWPFPFERGRNQAPIVFASIKTNASRREVRYCIGRLPHHGDRQGAHNSLQLAPRERKIRTTKHNTARRSFPTLHNINGDNP